VADCFCAEEVNGRRRKTDHRNGEESGELSMNGSIGVCSLFVCCGTAVSLTYCYNCGNTLQYDHIVSTENMMSTSSIRLDQDLVEKAAIMAKAYSRSTAKQIEHWAKIGKMMEDNPELSYEFVRQAIISKAEKEAGKLEEYHFG